MPMPELDPTRYVPVLPVDLSHRIPRSMNEPGRFFGYDPANPDLADLFDPYVAQLLAGGSLRRACDVATQAAKTAAAKAEAETKAAAEKAASEPGKSDAPPQTSAVKADPSAPSKPAA